MAVWPPSLPQSPEGTGYHEQPPYHLIDTPVEVGPAKRRPRYTAGIRSFAVSLVLTAAEVAVLETFYRDTVLGGTDPFDWVHPRTQAPATLRFTEEPDCQAIGPSTYRVTVQLEIIP